MLLAQSTTSSTVHSDGGPLGANFVILLLGEPEVGADCVDDIAEDGASDSWIGLRVDASLSLLVGVGDQGDERDVGMGATEIGVTGSTDVKGLDA